MKSSLGLYSNLNSRWFLLIPWFQTHSGNSLVNLQLKCVPIQHLLVVVYWFPYPTLGRMTFDTLVHTLLIYFFTINRTNIYSNKQLRKLSLIPLLPSYSISNITASAMSSPLELILNLTNPYHFTIIPSSCPQNDYDGLQTINNNNQLPSCCIVLDKLPHQMKIKTPKILIALCDLFPSYTWDHVLLHNSALHWSCARLTSILCVSNFSSVSQLFSYCSSTWSIFSRSSSAYLPLIMEYDLKETFLTTSPKGNHPTLSLLAIFLYLIS